MNRLLRAFTFVLLAVVLVGVGWWAGSVAMEPPDDPLAQTEGVTYTVNEGSIGRTLQFAAVSEWEFEDLARNAAEGVVTSLDVAGGDIVDVGDVLYRVNLRPVIVAQGAIPAFRELSLRASGDDVAQLQTFLGAEGLYEGEIDGVFGAEVRTAVRAWQTSLGLESDGTVRQGDLIFVPELPARIVLSDEVLVGSPLSGGESVVRRVLDEVQFWIPLSPEQRGLVPLSTDVRVLHGDSAWDARITEAVEDEARGELNLMLAGTDGGSVCGQECDDVSLRGQTSFPAELVVIPETIGPVVPVAAVQSLPDGSTFVTLENGSQVPVAVVAASDGLAVVDGLEAGDVILLPVTADES